MAEETSKKKKRRLRAASEPVSMRERAEKLAQEQEAAAAKAQRKLKTPKAVKADKPKRTIFAPFRAIWRPIRWLGRHIIPGYFKSAFRELRQTTWPTRKQSRQLTTAVVVFAVVFGAFVSALDYGLDKLFKVVFAK